MEKNASFDEALRYRDAGFFFDEIEDDWRQLKVDSLPMKHPAEVVAFTEDMANFFLDYIDSYATKVNANHTVHMSELIGKIAIKIDGIAVSQKLKDRLAQIQERNAWPGH